MPWFSVSLGRGASAGVLLLLATACGTQTGEPEPSGAAESVEVKVSDKVQVIHDQVYEFYDSWVGGVSGHQAAEVLISYGQNGAFMECQVARGYDVSWHTTVDYSTYWDGLNATGWLRDPGRPRESYVARGAAFNSALERFHNRTPEVPVAVINECLDQTTEMGEAAASALGYPHLMERLMKEWDERIVAATASVTGTREDYLACVLAGDLPKDLAGSPDIDSLYEAIDKAVPADDKVPVGVEPPTPEWAEWHGIEQQLLTVEWACAEPVYEAGMMTLPAVIEQFERDFGPEIAELTRHWEQLRADARALGWSEQRPYLSNTPEGWVHPSVAEAAPLS